MGVNDNYALITVLVHVKPGVSAHVVSMAVALSLKPTSTHGHCKQRYCRAPRFKSVCTRSISNGNVGKSGEFAQEGDGFTPAVSWIQWLPAMALRHRIALATIAVYCAFCACNAWMTAPVRSRGLKVLQAIAQVRAMKHNVYTLCSASFGCRSVWAW